jgi:hypothetical protein
MTYATKAKAIAALESKGFLAHKTMGGGMAGFHKGSAHAWITEDWSREHRSMRFRTHIAGA